MKCVLATILIFALSCQENSEPLPLRSAHPHIRRPDDCHEFQMLLTESTASESPFLIAHGGGSYKNIKMSESFEALNASYDSGFRMFEIDFRKTRDNQLVGIHDWESWFERPDVDGLNKGFVLPTRQEFVDKKTVDGLQPVDLEKTQEWFEEKKDSILVTDKTQDFSIIQNANFDPERIMVEVFSFENYISALEAGIGKPILAYSATRYSVSKKQYLEFIDSWNVQFMSIPIEELSKETELIHEITDSGVCLMVYTINDYRNVKELSEFGGIFGIYTDFVKPEN